jgi:pimeloyl-ACP methyl ester carboxylesterase
MWEPQLRSFTSSHTVLRVDLPGFGRSPFESKLVSYRGAVREALDVAGIDRAAVVGVSLGGNTAIEANLRTWLAGPDRSLEEIDPGLREVVAELQRQVFRLQQGHDDLRADRLDPPASERLADIRLPTLVVTGDEDVDDIKQIAERLAEEIPGATRATIPAAAHLPNLERPEEFDRIVLGFLSGLSAP